MRGILFGAVSQRELLRKFQGGSMLSGNLGSGIEVNEADYPLDPAPTSQPKPASQPAN